ncbi:MAG TPA: asparagine synthase (glutamine-hydrolyzing) [Rhizomicrobium sp.]
MCGLSVILHKGGAPDLRSRLALMHAAIPHRGPDGESFLLLEGASPAAATSLETLPADRARLGMAFRRLKICDLSDAALQPMGDSIGKTWIVFNGEIYNFRELRTELQALGHVFRTQGDTEVILHAYLAWGEKCFARFEGMWALVVLDLPRNRLVLSRDRFGIKPLHWMIAEDGALLLASEIKQFVRPGRTFASNRPLIEMFLRGSRFPTLEETFFEGVRMMPPATWAAIDLDAPQAPDFKPYWDLADFTTASEPPSYAEAVERTEQLLARAVASHRRADVKVGALLSGGVDSSTLVGLACRDAPLPTYSLGYRDAAPRFCELSYVDAMVQRYGLENHEIGFDARWIDDNTDRILWTLEEPPLAMPAFAQYRVFELCRRQGATVVLDGQGADEIAAGYQYHQRAQVKDLLQHGHAVSALGELMAIGRRDRIGPARLFADYFVSPYLRGRTPMPWIASGGVRGNAAEFATARSGYGRDVSLVNRLLHFDVRWGNAKIILGYGDRSAMAHTVEARVPYFDRAFVEFMFSLPAAYKIAAGDRKHALRDVARRHVPAAITERPDRMGFGTPDEEMLRGPLLPLVVEAVNDGTFQNAGWVDGAGAARFVADFQQGAHQDFRAVWRLFVLGRWARRFTVSG